MSDVEICKFKLQTANFKQRIIVAYMNKIIIYMIIVTYLNKKLPMFCFLIFNYDVILIGIMYFYRYF